MGQTTSGRSENKTLIEEVRSGSDCQLEAGYKMSTDGQDTGRTTWPVFCILNDTVQDPVTKEALQLRGRFGGEHDASKYMLCIRILPPLMPVYVYYSGDISRLSYRAVMSLVRLQYAIVTYCYHHICIYQIVFSF